MANTHARRFFPVVLILSLFSLVAQFASAHEIRPVIIDLSIAADNEITLVMEVNAEAILAGIGPEHDDTNTAPEKGMYDNMRQLDAAALEAKMAQFVPDWLGTISLPWQYSGFQTGPVGDTALARLSTITLQLTPDAGTDQLQLALPPLPGDIALRVHRPNAENAESHWIKAGSQFPVLALPENTSSQGWLKTLRQLFD